MSDFQAILVEGLFYDKEGSLHIERDDGEHVCLEDVLSPVLDRQVQLAVHHLPPFGIEVDKPGAGSCRFPGGKGCPVDHDQHPNRLLSFSMEGVLRKDPWRMHLFDGKDVPIPFAGMPGHFGRIGVATIVDVEMMREALSGLSPEQLAAAGLGSQDLEKILDRLRQSGERG